MKRGVVLSAAIVAIMLVSFGALVSAAAGTATAPTAYGQLINTQTGGCFGPECSGAAPSPAPEVKAPTQAETEAALGCTLEGEVKTCSVEGYPKFSVDASVKIQMVDGTLKLIATSSDKDSTITFLEDGSKLTLKPGATFTLNNVAEDTPWCNRLLNRRNIIRTPTAVAAVRGSEETGFSKFLNGLCARLSSNRVRTPTAVTAVRGNEETGFSKFLNGIKARLQARNTANVRTPTAVAAVRGTEEI